VDSKGVSQDTLLTYNVSTGALQEQKLATIDLFNRVAWSPDGKYFAGAYMDKGLVYVVDLHTGQIAYTYSGPGTVVDLDWSPDSQRVVSGFGDGLDETRVWDATTGAHVVTHKGGTTPAWSPDGKYIATARTDPSGKQQIDTIEIWDAQTAQNVYTYKANQGHVYALAWSPDSTSIASGEGNYNGKLSDVRVWRAIA
jgi:WD40 repeat protein